MRTEKSQKYNGLEGISAITIETGCDFRFVLCLTLIIIIVVVVVVVVVVVFVTVKYDTNVIQIDNNTNHTSLAHYQRANLRCVVSERERETPADRAETQSNRCSTCSGVT